MNCFSFLSLGYALHYIEDYFTFPHNSWYPEPMSEHVLYEIKFMNYIRENKNDINKPLISNNGRGVSADRMLDYLVTNHKQYAANEQGFDNDYSFITSVGYAFVTNYVKLFMINSGKDIVIDMNSDSFALNTISKGFAPYNKNAIKTDCWSCLYSIFLYISKYYFSMLS